MYYFYAYNEEWFKKHYHNRSNVEPTFSMMKQKFGSRLMSKKGVAQVNEVLCKVLCHNICVVIQSMYELGIEPVSGVTRKRLPRLARLRRDRQLERPSGSCV